MTRYNKHSKQPFGLQTDTFKGQHDGLINDSRSALHAVADDEEDISTASDDNDTDSDSQD